MSDDAKGWYRFTVNQFNNMVVDGKDCFSIYGKYFEQGIEHLRPRYPEFCDTMMKLYGIMRSRRNRFVLLVVLSVVFNIPLLRLRKIAG